MGCNFRTVLNWIVLVALCVLALFVFINWICRGSLWLDGFFIAAYMIIACIFTGCAPFGWIGIVKELFAYMDTKIWRPCFVIILSCFFFPRFEDGAWSTWYWAIVYVASLVNLVCGVIELVLDLCECCGCCSCE